MDSVAKGSKMSEPDADSGEQMGWNGERGGRCRHPEASQPQEVDGVDGVDIERDRREAARR